MPLGPHGILVTDAGLAWAKRSQIVKQLDGTALLEAAPDSAVRVFRQSTANEMDTTNPIGRVDETITGLKGYNHHNLYLQLWCGAHPTYKQLLVAVGMCHRLGYKTVGSSWFTGDYTQQDWMDALDAGVDAYGPQCYWGTQGFTLDHAVRYRRFWTPGQKPVMILECGRDKVEGGRGGWMRDNLAPTVYAGELMGYDREISKDAFVLGATPFTSGPTHNDNNPNIDWRPFDTDPISHLLPTGGPVPVVTSNKMTPGIDVSNHQGAIDWPLVARCGPQFAVIKATEGTTYLDPFFVENWRGAKDAGLVRGAYCYGRPSKGSGHADAQHFLDVVEAEGIAQGDFLVLDLEDPNVSATADLLAYAVDWLSTVKAAVGFNPMIYSGHYYLDPHNLEGKTELKDTGLWLASYQSQPPPPPNGWSFWAMWQYHDHGVVPGIGGEVDLDLFHGSIDLLKRYGKP